MSGVFLCGLASHIRAAVLQHQGRHLPRRVLGDSPGGDAQFDVDEVAEAAANAFVLEHGGGQYAVYSEGGSGSLQGQSRTARKLLVIDPIDGTRPVSAGFESGMVSIAQAPLKDAVALRDIDAAVLMEIKSGDHFFAEEGAPVMRNGAPFVPVLSQNRALGKMFWSIEFNGHPMHLMTSAYGTLVDASANTGGVFVFNSATYSISRIFTGQLDAYVDVGNRLLKEHPHLLQEFLRAGRGSVLHLFPYDIAAANYLAVRTGVTVTDGFGASLGSTLLTDLSAANQRSCVAASNPHLHAALIERINWKLAKPKPD